jgi:hypothetical protein
MLIYNKVKVIIKLIIDLTIIKSKKKLTICKKKLVLINNFIAINKIPNFKLLWKVKNLVKKEIILWKFFFFDMSV